MADSKISELTALTSPASDDVLPIVDTSAGVTKKITVSNLQSTSFQFVLEDGDGTEVTINNNNEVKFVEGGGIDINWTDTDNGSDADPYDLTFSIDSTVATLTGSQTLTNKTLTSPVLNTGVSGTAIKDEDNMASDSATHLATQQSIKAYVDTTVAATNEVVEDTSPQLGGDLDVNGNAITSASNGHIEITPNGTGKVGISESSPDTLLHITQGGEPPAEGMLILEANSGSRQLRIQPPTNSDNGFIDYRGGNLVFMDDGTEVARFQGTTGFGIGTSSPSEKITIQSGNLNFMGGTNDAQYIKFGDTGDDDIGNIFYYHGNNNMVFTTNASEAMRIDSSGNVGIGESSALGKLHVKSADSGASVDASADELVIEGSANTGISILSGASNSGSIYFGDSGLNYDGYIAYSQSSRNFSFGTAGAERMRIDSSGNVGIGTASPNRKLHVVGASGTAQIQSTGTTSALYFGDTNSSSIDNQGIHSSGNNMYISAGGYERMRINSSGNVSIGTTDAHAQLTVMSASCGAGANGDADELQLEGSGNAGMTIASGSSSSGNIHFADVGAANRGILTYDHSADQMKFGTAGTIRARFTSVGDLLVAKSSSDYGAVGHELLAGGLAAHSRSQNPTLLLNRNTSEGTIQLFRYNNSDVGSISVTSSSTAFNTSSDYRLKENVSYDFDATSRLKQLKPSRFNFIADADKTVDGFLAHEVSDIVPEAITGEKDETETKEKVVLNANGNVIAEGIEEADWVTGKSDILWTSDDTETQDILYTSDDVKTQDVLYTEEDELPEGVEVGDVKESATKSVGDVKQEATQTVGDVKTEAIYPSDSTWEASKVIPVYQGIDQSKLVPLLVKTIQELEARITTLENN